MVYEAESGDILLALTGESLITRAMKPFREPKFLELRDLLYSADVRFTNLEMLFHNYEDPPTYRPGGTYMRCDPRYIEDLKWLGINIVGTANNHSYDFGENGVLTNLGYLGQYDLPNAGTGANMGEAAGSVYMDTPKGRVALIAATSSGVITGRAGEQRRDVIGRPGSNFVRWQQYWTVEREAFDALKKVADEMGWTEQADARREMGLGDPSSNSDTEVLFFDHGSYEEESATRFVLGESYERHSVIDLNIPGNAPLLKLSKAHHDQRQVVSRCVMRGPSVTPNYQVSSASHVFFHCPNPFGILMFNSVSFS